MRVYVRHVHKVSQDPRDFEGPFEFGDRKFSLASAREWLQKTRGRWTFSRKRGAESRMEHGAAVFFVTGSYRSVLVIPEGSEAERESREAIERLWKSPRFVHTWARIRCEEDLASGDTGLCPVCGERVYLTGWTTDGRTIGSCGDAFECLPWAEESE